MSSTVAEKPASFLSSPSGRDRDPASRIAGMPPNFGDNLLPHVITFQGILSSIARVYRSPDEALRDSRDNARFMRNDPTIMECLEQRQRSTALLNWHLEPDNEQDSRQKELCEHLKTIIEHTPRFMQYRENLLHALWYGKYGIQHRYRWRKIRGQMRIVVDQWLPVNGDKIVFRFDDGTGMYDPDQVGIRVGAGFTTGNAVATRWSDNRKRKVEQTDYGLAYFLEPWERRMLAIHKHLIEDGDYDDAISSGKIHGLGIRSRIYWTWYQKQESLAWLMEFLERSAFGFEIWYYPWGNNEALETVKTAAMERIGQGRNIVFMPRPQDESGGMAYGVDKIEANMAGAETLERILKEYFGHQIKRYILGQTLTSEADATGLGSNLASIHLDTYLQIIRYDATNLEESLTTELVEPLKLFNFPQFKDIPIRFRIDTEAADVEGKLQAWERAYNMGVKLRAQDVMDLIGAGKPDSDEDALLNPMIAKARAEMRQAEAQDQSQTGQSASVPGGPGDEDPRQPAIGGPVAADELWKNLQAARILQALGIGPDGSGNGERIIPRLPDQLHGGKADSADPSQFDQQELHRGVIHEMEHTDDPAIALEIAMDHLAEHQDYYDMLEKFEGDEESDATENYQKLVEEERESWEKDIAHGDVKAFLEFVICTNKEDADAGEYDGIGNQERRRLKKEWRSLSPDEKLKWHRRRTERYSCDPADKEEYRQAGGSFLGDFARGFVESLHPRGNPKNAGQFRKKGSGASGRKAAAPAPSKDVRSAQAIIHGHRHEVREAGGTYWYRDASNRNSMWQPAPENVVKWMKEQIANRPHEQPSEKKEKKPARQPASAKRWTPPSEIQIEEAKQSILAGLEYGPERGSRLRSRLRIDLPTFVDAYFALADADAIWQDPRTGVIYLGKEPGELPSLPESGRGRPRQPQEPRKPVDRRQLSIGEAEKRNPNWFRQLNDEFKRQLSVKVAERSPAEKAAAETEKKEAEVESRKRKVESDKEVRKAQREENIKRLTTVAADYEISPDDLADAAKFVLEERKKIFDEREAAKEHARQLTGLTAKDIALIENSGGDYTSVKNGLTGQKLRAFDEFAQEVAREHPGILGNADDPNADFAARLWELLREGKGEPLSLYDSEILDEAANYVTIHQHGLKQPEEAETIPFAREGERERYHRYLEWRRRYLDWRLRETHRREQVECVASLADQYFAEHYAKSAASGQKSFAWTNEDEKKHPRAKDGKWADKKGDTKIVGDRTYRLNEDDLWERVRQEGDAIPKVAVTGNEFGHDLPAPELRARARDYWKEHLKGKPFVNNETRISVVLSRQGIDEILAHSGDIRRAWLIAVVPQLIETAVLIDHKPHAKPQKPKYDQWLYFHAEANLAGTPFEMILEVGAKKHDGHWLYTIDKIQEIRKPAPKKGSGETPGLPHNSGPSTTSIGLHGEKVKPDSQHYAADPGPELTDSAALSDQFSDAFQAMGLAPAGAGFDQEGGGYHELPDVNLVWEDGKPVDILAVEHAISHYAETKEATAREEREWRKERRGD